MAPRQRRAAGSEGQRRGKKGAAAAAEHKASVAFVHPDLGLGGAERLVVDAGTAAEATGARARAETQRGLREERERE